MTTHTETLDTTRHILPGVRKVSFWSPDSPWCPEDICFPSCLGAVLAYRGDARLGCKKEPRAGQGDACSGCDTLAACRYGMLMSLSGEAFAGSWNLAEWDMGNDSVLRIDDDPVAPLRRVMDALGYDYDDPGQRQPAGPEGGRAFPLPHRRPHASRPHRRRPSAGPPGSSPGGSPAQPSLA